MRSKSNADFYLHCFFVLCVPRRDGFVQSFHFEPQAKNLR